MMEIPTDCKTQIITGVDGEGVEVDFGRSPGLRNAILVHEVFKPGGKICHNSRGSQVKCPLEILLVVQHPNVHLKPDAGLVQFITQWRESHESQEWFCSLNSGVSGHSSLFLNL